MDTSVTLGRHSRTSGGPGGQGRDLLVIHNPSAGGGRRRLYAETLRRLEALGCRIEARETAARGDAEAWARAALAGGCDRVVAAGGDGTINEVINGLAGSGLPLAILPLGTANVLAAEIGLRLDPATLARTIARGRARPVCLGRVRSARGAERTFIMMAGVGVDAHAVAGVSAALKRRIGKGAYYAEAVRQFAVFPFRPYRLRIDGRSVEAASAVVANGRYYAGRYVLAPEARLEEPRLSVCLFERSGRWPALNYALAMQIGRLGGRPDYRIVPACEVSIEGAVDDPVQADGDLVAGLPVEIDALPGGLELVLPAP